MPAADYRVHDNQPTQVIHANGISIRKDVLFANYKGEEQERIQKSSEKRLQKLQPALQRMLLPDEAVLHIAPAQSPLTILEQFTAAWWTRMLAASAVVLTNKRILFFPVKRNGSWKESARGAAWGDLEEVKAKGLLVKNVTFKFKSGAKTTYTNFSRADAKKIAAIALALLPAASGEQTSKPSLLQLCPDCRNVLTEGLYSCSTCGLIFKNEKSMVMRSIFLPGGGYFYTRHPLIGILPAIVEGIFILDVLVLLFAGLATPNTVSRVLPGLLILALFWAFETAITILHCRRYVREFIPEKRDPARAQQNFAAPNAG